MPEMLHLTRDAIVSKSSKRESVSCRIGIRCIINANPSVSQSVLRNFIILRKVSLSVHNNDGVLQLNRPSDDGKTQVSGRLYVCDLCTG